MISLDQIVSNNLEMLKSQEADLLKSLNFVQKAKQLFQAHWGTTSTAPATGTTTGKRRGRRAKRKAKVTPKVAAAPKRTTKKAAKAKPAAKANTGEKRVSHLTNILNILKSSGKPMGSGDVIATLFKRQTADKDIKHFRLLIYPVLTKAYASKTLLLKDGKIHLPK